MLLFFWVPTVREKTSLLRIMAGLIVPVSGVLQRGDTAVADDPDAHQATLHYLDDRDAAKPALTVMENLAFAAAFTGCGTSRSFALCSGPVRAGGFGA